MGRKTHVASDRGAFCVAPLGGDDGGFKSVEGAGLWVIDPELARAARGVVAGTEGDGACELEEPEGPDENPLTREIEFLSGMGTRAGGMPGHWRSSNPSARGRSVLEQSDWRQGRRALSTAELAHWQGISVIAHPAGILACAMQRAKQAGLLPAPQPEAIPEDGSTVAEAVQP